MTPSPSPCVVWWHFRDPPPPLECQVLFEWPLVFFDSFFIILVFEKNTGHTNTSDGPLSVCLFEFPDLDRKSSFCECGREKSVLCILSIISSSLDLIKHLPHNIYATINHMKMSADTSQNLTVHQTQNEVIKKILWLLE